MSETQKLANIFAYKTIYVLSTVDEVTGRLRGVKYAACVVGGRHPLWGVYSLSGKLIRWYSYRSEIESDLPQLAWRTKAARLESVDIADRTATQKRLELEQLYAKPTPYAAPATEGKA